MAGVPKSRRKRTGRSRNSKGRFTKNANRSRKKR